MGEKSQGPSEGPGRSLDRSLDEVGSGEGQVRGSFPYQAVDVYSRGPILTVCRAPWAARPSGVKGSGPAAGEGQGQEEVGGTGRREGGQLICNTPF